MNKIGMSGNTLNYYKDYIEAQQTMDTLIAKIKLVKPHYERLKLLYENARLNELKSMDYQLYLQTDEWKCKRREAIENAHGKCERCGSSDVELNVHHLTYERRAKSYQKI